MNISNKIIATAIGAMSLCGMASAAFAGSELEPGDSAGIPFGAPLPPGVYTIITPNFGYINSTPGTDVAATLAFVSWSTPWTIAGGHLAFDARAIANLNVHGRVNSGGFLNPLVDAQLKWDLGNGFFGGFHAGAYIPLQDEMNAFGLTKNYASFSGVGALSYLKDGWNISGTLFYGSGKSGAVGSLPDTWGTNWVNFDFTGTHKFGKFELGVVAYASADLDQPVPGYRKQTQIAAGGLVGYDFGAVTLQFKLTRVLSEANYGGMIPRLGQHHHSVMDGCPPPAAAVAARVTKPISEERRPFGALPLLWPDMQPPTSRFKTSKRMSLVCASR